MPVQLDLFNINGFGHIAEPATTPLPTQTQIQPQPFTIERNPLKGYRVVVAPGLTHAAPMHPCRSNNKADCRKTTCSKCRAQYLEQIGESPISTVDCEGSYGLGK
jgi:hypothetical protein